jgi:tetratricopeptide (TPR) repeat protein
MSSTPCSIFISYNHSTTSLSEDLHKKLAADGFTVVRDIQVGFTENFTEFMKKIRQTDYALLLINEPYLKSINCMFEITEILKDDEYKKRILPLVMEGTTFYQAQDITEYIVHWKQKKEQLTQSAKQLDPANMTAHTFDAKRIDRILTDLDIFLNELRQMNHIVIPKNSTTISNDKYQIVKKHLDDELRKKKTFVTSNSPQHWNVPHRQNPNFTGREDILKQLLDSLHSGRVAAITAVHGLGGIGKTQVAIQYVYTFRSEYEVIWWVRSEQPISLVSDYAGLAAELNLPEKDAKEQAVPIEAVKHWFGQHEKWLLVFDNVHEPKDIKLLLPQGAGGHVIITSRNPNWRGVADQLKIQIWDKKESTAFIIKRTGINNSAAAGVLAEELGNLPLALEQACAYIEARGKTLPEYLSLFQLRQKELLTKGELSTDYPDSVATTWSMAFENLSIESASLLNICSFMAPDGIDWNLFSKKKDKICSQEIDKTIKTVLTDPLLFDEAVEILRKYSLIEIQNGNISLHRLVQAVTRDRLAEEEKKRWGKDVLKMNQAVFPEKSEDARFWPECKILVPHAMTLLALLDQMKYESEDSAYLLDRIANYLWSQAEYAKAEPLHRHSLSIREQQLGPMHCDVALSLNGLALLLQDQGKYAEAEPLFRRSLSNYEQQLGENHPHVAGSLNNLAKLFQDQGKYSKAEPLFRRSLSIREQKLGENHPDVAMSLNNLAALLYAQGKYEEAEPLFRRSLRIWEQQLGENHPDVAGSLNNLASLLQDQGKYAEAEPLYRRSLSILEQQLGEKHPDVAGSLNNLASLLQDQGKYAEAEPLYRRAVVILEKSLGNDHPNTIQGKKNLESLLEKMINQPTN